MTLEQLRIFVSVAEHLHVTRAAEDLHITQSGASAAIAALEARYATRLFDRVGRGIELSSAGHAFLPEARAVLARADAAARSLDDLAGLKRGELTISASQTVSTYWLPARLARFARAHPGVTLRLSIGNTAQVAHAVIAREAELGFVEGLADSPLLARTKIGGDRLAVYAAPGHPLANGRLNPDGLCAATWVLREPGSGTRAVFEQAIALRGIEPGGLTVALELPSNEAVLAAVASSDLLTAVSELAAAALVKTGRIVRLDYELPERIFQLLTHRERRGSRAASVFVDEL